MAVLDLPGFSGSQEAIPYQTTVFSINNSLLTNTCTYKQIPIPSEIYMYFRLT